MSANNWTECPKCAEIHRRKCKEERDKLNGMYGKVSREEFVAAEIKVKKLEGKEYRETLREDFEIGINADGAFEVDYKASCSVCNLNFKHAYQVQAIPLDDSFRGGI